MQTNKNINIGSFIDFDYMKIGIASPEKILSWSYGEVKNSDTLNYRTLKPEKDGLFCTKIFGPVRDYECSCGKYRKIKYKGIRCEKCDTDVVESSVRRERMGHIDLCYPVVNILYIKSTPSVLSILLDAMPKDILAVIYFEKYIVVDAGKTKLKKYQIISKYEYSEILKTYADSGVEIESGAKGIQLALEKFNLEEEYNNQQLQMKKVTSETKLLYIKKRLNVIKSFIDSKTLPHWMVFRFLPVIPPDLRPIVPLEAGRVAVSDINKLYANVINRNNRLKNLLAMEAPEIMIQNECRMLQDAVNSLFLNSSSSNGSKVAVNSFGKPLKSIADLLKGKNGYLRQNLLGKRVDYSGRSVIVSGPELKLHQCGLPKLMAIELFKPFIISKLRLYGKIKTIKEGLDKINKLNPEIFDILEEVVVEHPVLLNRAPTLHRLGIQAFEPKLIETKAIQLHPLVCRAFNADFDGDQMAIHVPLSIEAQIESRVLMLSSNNILSPGNGSPMIVPRKDITVGLYYMTTAFDNEKGEGHTFYSYHDVLNALNNDLISLNTKIKYYYKYDTNNNDAENKVNCLTETTAGRIILFQYIPCDGKISFDEINQPWSVGFLTKIVKKRYEVYGAKATVIFCDRIMKEGFKYATVGSVSFGKDDICVPEDKYKLIEEVKEKIKLVDKQFEEGYITKKERYNKVTDYWSECIEQLCDKVMDLLNVHSNESAINSIKLMMNSGARASKAQMKQLAGMKGLIAKPNGTIIETPVISNFKEGLSVVEYFNAAHGARKGNVDIALKTADAGYLTRRLVDVAQDCIVTEKDCGDHEGILFKQKIKNGKVIKKLSEIILGRFLSKDILDENGNILLKADTFIDKAKAQVLDEHNIKEAYVRSPVTCKCKYGICSKCYGTDLSTLSIVNVGEAVGVIAAQTIGEPGTQLTLNTFHVGGIATKQIDASNVITDCNGIVKFVDLKFVVNQKGERIVVSKSGAIEILDNKNNVICSKNIPYSSKLLVNDGDKVLNGDALADHDPYNLYIVSEYDGKIKYNDLVRNSSYIEKTDESLGNTVRMVLNHNMIQDTNLSPSLIVCDKEGKAIKNKEGLDVFYVLSDYSEILVDNESEVKIGDPIIKIPRQTSNFVSDITGGLPKVEEIFEARTPANSAIISGADGYVEIVNKNKIKIIIHPDDSSIDPIVYSIPKGKFIHVRNGDRILRGDIIVDGSKNLNDLLTYNGLSDVTINIVNSIQDVYSLQGIDIDSKHIEVIAKYMLNKAVVDDKGDTKLDDNYVYDVYEIREENAKAEASGLKPAKYHIQLNGISKSALQTDSFIAAASFKETIKVLTNAAVKGKKDELRGMKESMIIGRLIPAGTGFATRQLKHYAMEKIGVKDSKVDIGIDS